MHYKTSTFLIIIILGEYIIYYTFLYSYIISEYAFAKKLRLRLIYTNII